METSRRGSTGGLILIALGVFFLLINLTDQRAWGILLGLGLVFLLAYFWSGRYGLLVPGWLLVALGVALALEHGGWVAGYEGPTFAISLGLGFILIYVSGRRWGLFWPLLPGGVLLWVGLLVLLTTRVHWLSREELVGLWRWWPLLLVLLGVWAFLRPRLGPRGQRWLRVMMLVLLVVGVLLLLTAAGLAVSRAAWRPDVLGQHTGRVERVLPASQRLVVANTSGGMAVRLTCG